MIDYSEQIFPEVSKSKHWLLKKSRPLTLNTVMPLSDSEARYMLAELRWAHEDRQDCPKCGTQDKHYDIKSRHQWRCKHCNHTFSVTSGTPFEHHKLSYKRLLMALVTYVINQKGISALAMSRTIGGQYRTSYVLMQKIREVMVMGLESVNVEKLCGIVEVDGAHLSGRPRKGRTASRPTRADKTEVPKKYSKKAQHRDKAAVSDNPFHPNRRIVLVMREVDPQRGKGAIRTIAAVVRSENKEDIQRLAKKYIQAHSVIRTDELPGYKALPYEGYTHQTVNHSLEFSTDEGVNQNQAESYFSRMRRAVMGVWHRITPKYMLEYMQEIAWREDTRRTNTHLQLQSIVRRVFASGVSVDWTNYGRKGHGRRVDDLSTAGLT